MAWSLTIRSGSDDGRRLALGILVRPQVLRSATNRAAARKVSAFAPNLASALSDVGHQFLKTRARALETEGCNKCRLAGRGVLAGSFAECLGIALNVKQIVGDLESLADRNAITVDIGKRGRVGFSENRRQRDRRNGSTHLSSSPAV